MEDSTESSLEKTPKRRGAQLGNQNARKHGFYSKVLTLAERQSLDEAVDVDGIDGEIALLRVKIKSIVEHDPDNIELIVKAVVTLTRMLMARDTIGKDRGGIKQAVRDVLKDLALPVGLGIGSAFQR